MNLEALRQGHCFIDVGLPAPTHGYHFITRGLEQSVQMGDDVNINGGVTFQIRLPMRSVFVLLKDDKSVYTRHIHEQ